MLATPLETATLPPGIRSRFVRGVNGLDIHILEAGYAPAGRPLVLLLHGFPEIAYSWRKVMPALAEAGFHAVAPDQRGYGRTTGWSPDFEPICGRGARSTPCATRSASSRRWGTVRSTPSSATISAPGSPRGVRWFGPTCSARWR